MARIGRLLTVLCLASLTAQAQRITDFRFKAASIGWNDDCIGVIDNTNRNITFTTQKWVDNIEHLRASFELDGDYEVKVGDIVQISGITENDFRRKLVYTINGNLHYSVIFISPQASGLPVINIETQNKAEIKSKTDYLFMTFALTDPNNPENNISKTEMSDEIRGRGNDSWSNPNAKKKSYRIRFAEKTSIFGLVAAKGWVLIAQYRDATLLYNATAFELGKRFAMPFNHSFHFVELYLNGDYKGNYLLSEPNQVNEGRVDIHENDGWLVEIDGYYDEEPKFRTTNYELPVMINSPEFEPANINNPLFDFVIKDVNALTNAVASSAFPENGYRNMINMNTFVDYLMITEITDNKEIQTPMSTFMYKDKGGLINMGPLWDFDCGYGYNYNYTHFANPRARTPICSFFARFFNDPVFILKYKERWNEKYNDIVSMPMFMDEMAAMLEKSAEHNFKTWWYRTYTPWINSHPYEANNFLNSVALLKNYYNAHVAFLNSEINKVEVFPEGIDFGTSISEQTFIIVSYDEISDLTADFINGNLSKFEIIEPIQQQATGKGGFLTYIRVKPKNNQPATTYNGQLLLKGKNQGVDFSLTAWLKYKETKEPEPTITSDCDIPQKAPLTAWTSNGILHINGLASGEMLSIYSSSGLLVYQKIATSEEENVKLHVKGVYIVCSGKDTVKVTYQF